VIPVSAHAGRHGPSMVVVVVVVAVVAVKLVMMAPYIGNCG
jgi:hypothetical protein